MAGQVTFDEQEHPVTIPVFPFPPGGLGGPRTDAFPAEANKIHIHGSAFPVPYNFGWLFLDLNQPGPTLRQSWVETIMKAQGQYSVGFAATPFSDGCAPPPRDPGY
jgi:hypothetical protein